MKSTKKILTGAALMVLAALATTKLKADTAPSGAKLDATPAALSNNPVAPANPVAPPGAAALVNDEAIPLSKVTDIALDLEGTHVIDQFIGTVLIHQEAVRRHLAATPDEMEARIDGILKHLHHKSILRDSKARFVLFSQSSGPPPMRTLPPPDPQLPPENPN